MFPYRKAGDDRHGSPHAAATYPAAFNPVHAVRAIAPSLAGIHVSTAIAAGLLGLALLVH